MAKHANPNDTNDDVVDEQTADLKNGDAIETQDAPSQDLIADVDVVEAVDVDAVVDTVADELDEDTDVSLDSADNEDDEALEIAEEKVRRGSHVQATIDERKQREAEEALLAQQEEAADAFFDDAQMQVDPISAQREQIVDEAPAKKASSHLKKSRRVRIVLMIVIALLLVAFGGLVYLFVNQLSVVNEHMQTEAQRASSSEQMDVSNNGEASAVKQDFVPQVSSVVGKTQDEALQIIGHGAVVTKSSDIVEKTTEKDSEGNETETEEVVGVKVTVSLKDDPTDSQGNTPSVYVKLDKDGYVTQVGFSSSLTSLGVGDCSFGDAVTSMHVVHDVLGATGVTVEPEALVLPEDKSAYRTMGPDGKTLAEERYTFSGDVDIDGTSYPWTCTLVYDYSAKNVSGNFSDTIRLIYVYIGA